MFKKFIRFLSLTGGLIFAFLVMVPAVFADHPDVSPQLENLKKRIEALEAAQPYSYEPDNAAGTGDNPEINNLEQRIKTLEEQAEKATSPDISKISEHLNLHGLLEVEATYTKPEGGGKDSDLTLATAELSLEARLNQYASGHLALLYEEQEDEDNDVEFDEAVISLTLPIPLVDHSASLHAGRMYVPFGTFESYMITDPLTLDLGETRATAALIALEGDVWSLKGATFNGEADTSGGNDNIDTWVSSLEVSLGESIRFGSSFISDLAESDDELVSDQADYSSNVPGASAFISVQYGDLGFIAEYLGALEKFDSSLVDAGTDLTGKRPEAWNLELAWRPLERLEVAARYEKAHDFQDNVSRYGSTVSYGLFEQVVIALEFLHANADVDEDDPVNIVTTQLALEF